MSGLPVDVDGTNLDRAGLGGGDARRPVQRGVERGAVQNEIATERLLHVRVWPVAHELVALADPDGRRGCRRGELFAADEDAGCACRARELRVLLVARRTVLVARVF